MNGRLPRVSLACLTLLLAQVAQAQVVDDGTRNAARDLAGQGKDAFEHRDFERARDLFHRAYTLVPAPTIALYEARALAHLHRFIEAEEAYLRAVRTSLDASSSEPFRQAVRDADRELTALRPRIPKVTIALSGRDSQSPDLVIALDGRVMTPALVGVEVPIDPGEHVITATNAGARVERAFTVAEKERKTVPLEAPIATAAPTAPSTDSRAPARVSSSDHRATPNHETAPRKPPSSWQRNTAFAVGGVGVAGLATGLVTGLLASARYTKAEKLCPDHVCLEGSEGESNLHAFRTLRTVSTTGYVAGAVGLAVGVTLFVTAPSRSSSRASVKVWIGASELRVGGAF